MPVETPTSRPRGADKLLKVTGLSTHFFTPDGVVQAGRRQLRPRLRGDAWPAQRVRLWQERHGASIARLIPDPPGKIIAGEIVFDGIDVLKMNDDDMRHLRGKEIGFIFQDPLTSLNPTLTIGYQIAESIREHMGLSATAATDRVAELLGKVGIPERASDSRTIRTSSPAGCANAS